MKNQPSRSNSKGGSRISKINDELLKEISLIIQKDLKDPRISAVTTVTSVNTTTDLKHCKVSISVLGDNSQKKEALDGLRNAAGYIRHTLAERVNLRNTPELKFIIDDQAEYIIKMNKLIKEANEGL